MANQCYQQHLCFLLPLSLPRNEVESWKQGLLSQRLQTRTGGRTAGQTGCTWTAAMQTEELMGLKHGGEENTLFLSHIICLICFPAWLLQKGAVPCLPVLPGAGVCWSFRYTASRVWKSPQVKTIVFLLLGQPLGWSNSLVWVIWVVLWIQWWQWKRTDGKQGLKRYGKWGQDLVSRCFHSCLTKVVLCYAWLKWFCVMVLLVYKWA